MALIFKQVFNYGLPAIGNALHIEFLQTSLLGTKWGAIFAAVFVLLWQGVAMPIIIFLAGLQSIPTEITEAARKSGVPVYEDDSLATLLSRLQLGAAVPEELYQAIIEIYIYFLGYVPSPEEKENEEKAENT